MFTRSTKRIGAGAFFAAVLSTAAIAQSAPQHYGFGTKVDSAELAKYFSIPADGTGLPPGSGTAAAGAKVYADTCLACHGDKLQGNPEKGIGGDRLLGGRGSLATKTPAKTVESYWPYATTLFDYVKRAMPFNAPGSLKDDDVYAVVAYILSEAKIIKPTDTMNAQTLPKVAMPNKDGFIPDSRPELSLYR
jgi:S-disulfanyl-L-cysteine oxidoreductase SoxD